MSKIHPSSSNSQWVVYIIRCKNDALYTGVTLDINRRFEEHQSQGKKCAKFLKGKTPLELVFVKEMPDKKTAYQLEYRIKKMKKNEKEKLL